MVLPAFCKELRSVCELFLQRLIWNIPLVRAIKGFHLASNYIK